MNFLLGSPKKNREECIDEYLRLSTLFVKDPVKFEEERIKTIETIFNSVDDQNLKTKLKQFQKRLDVSFN